MFSTQRATASTAKSQLETGKDSNNMMFTKRQHHQEQRQQPPEPPPEPPPMPPPVVGIVPAPWKNNNMQLDDDDDNVSATRKTNQYQDCGKYAFVGPLQYQYLHQNHHQQQHPPPPRQQHQTLYVYLSGLLQRIGQSASAVERYRSLQELHAILSSSSSSSLQQTSEGDGRVEMLLNHSGDSVLCWQLAYIATTTTTTTNSQSCSSRKTTTRHHQKKGGVDVAVLALLLECLALIWTPKSSSSQPPPSCNNLPPPHGGLQLVDSRVQSMKQAAHTTLPILLQVSDAFAQDARIQKPLLFILRLYTKIRHAPTKSMLVKSGLVVHLRRALQRRLDNDNDDATFQHEAAARAHGNNNNNQDENLIPCILGLMKDLLFRAESTEKLYMYEEWHTDVLGIGTTPRYCYYYYMSSRLHQADRVANAEAISACLWNWAVSDELARRMALNPAVWETLHELLSMPNHEMQHQQQQQPQMPHLLASPRDQEDDDDEQQHPQKYPSVSGGSNNHHDNIWANVHRNALAALGTMIASCTITTTRSFDASNKNNTNNNETLQKQTWLVPCLCQILDRNEDKDSRRRCIRTLRCLSSCSWGRDFLLRVQQPPPAIVVQNPFDNNPSTTATLASSQQQQNHNQILTLFLRCLQRQDEEVDTRIQASLAIAALLPSCPATEWMAMGPYIETALVQTIENAAATADSSDDKLVLTAIQALQVCLDHNPWKRGGSGCFSHLFFESTLRVLRNQMSEPNYHATFASLILHLVNQKKISTSGGSNKSLTILICPPVAEILSTLLTPLGPDFEPSRSEALQAIVALTTTATATTHSNGQKNEINDNPNDDDAAVIVVDNENYRKNLKTLAANECLLNNLVNLCLIAPTFKDQAKSVILKLVPEL